MTTPENNKQNENEAILQKFKESGEEDYGDFLSDFDIATLLVVTRKSIFWLLLLFATSIFGTFLFNRYTKPIFESTSILKLDLKNNAGVLGFKGIQEEAEGSKHTTLSGEIEFLKSRLVAEKVLERLDLNVGYFVYGKILVDEKYRTAPFKVDYKITNHGYYNLPFDVTILNNEEFKLSYKVGEQEITNVYTFGAQIGSTDQGFVFKLIKEPSFAPEHFNIPYFFKVYDKETLISFITQNLNVGILNLDASTIKVSFKDYNSLKATDIVNTVDSVYLYETIAARSKAHEQTIAFLEESLQKTEKDLEEAEQKMEAFVRRNKTVDVKSDFGRVMLKMETLDAEKLGLKLQISMLRDLEELIRTNKDLQSFIPGLTQLPDPQLSSAIKELNTLYQERERTALSQKENTFALKQKDTNIEKVNRGILELVSQNKRILYQQIAELNNKMAELEGEVIGLPAKETEYVRLKRFYGLYEKLYLLLIEKQAEYGIAKAGTLPNFVILSPGLENKIPVYPNTKMLYIGSVFLGLFLCIIFIFFRYFLHDTIATQKELEKSLSASVLGGIPEYKKEKMEYSRLIVDISPKSAISEAFRSIRTNLEFVAPNKGKRILTVTSTVGGEGKTFVSTNLAGIIALSNQKVAILDFDMRKPKVHLAFGKENIRGISTVLIGKHTIEDCIHKTTIDNLDFISAGPIPPNPSELILRPEFDQLMVNLHKKYDTIVIDTPPVGLVTDGILLMKKADVQLYVVRANYSKKGVKKNINKVYRTGGFNKLSVVINAMQAVNTYGYGGYGYGYGYGYYEGDKKADESLLKKVFRKK
jgi:tyrosine-protein kinase Etk/Wzc